MSKKKLMIPFHEGNQLKYVDNWVKQEYKLDWKENHEFEETLTVTNMSRGRSAANFELQDKDGNKFNMFMTGMLEMVQKATIKKGKVKGTWTFVKRGANFGIIFIK